MIRTLRSVVSALGFVTVVAACWVDVSMDSEEAPMPDAGEPVTMSSPIESVSFRTFDVNGLSMRVAEAGEGPLVLFAHGWPESWYSWRDQIPAVTHLCGDLVGLVEALGHEQAVLVGHDWGAVAGWQCALLEPETFSATVNMSVPYRGRAERSPVETWKESFGDNFFYILYFQELNEDGSGVAEAEFDADPRAIL